MGIFTIIGQLSLSFMANRIASQPPQTTGSKIGYLCYWLHVLLTCSSLSIVIIVIILDFMQPFLRIIETYSN